MIYLDNAATTFPKPEAVYKAMDDMNRKAVNAGRGSYKTAHKMSEIISDTKQLIRNLVNTDAETPVIFSPSITVALNQIVNGFEYLDNENIYVSPYEHNAVARTIWNVSKKHKINIIEMPLNDDLEIDIEKLKYEFSKKKPSYIYCTHISNVTGYILPVDKIFIEGKKYGSINILDTAQSLGLIPVDSQKIGADIIAFAGHKTLYGPFGIGGFINISRINLDPFITGGTGSDSLNLDMPSGLEARYEAASMNMVAIAGLNAALKILNQKAILKHEKELTEYLINGLSEIKGMRVLRPKNKENRVGIISIVLDSMNSDDAGIILDEDYDIAVRTGYHCAPYIHSYLKDTDKMGTVRISVGQFTSIHDVDGLIKAIAELV